MFCIKEKEIQHIGWKFAALDEKNNPLPFFYALMIGTKDKNQEDAEHSIVGFKMPGWIGSQLRAI